MMTDEELQEIVDYSLEPRPEQVRCIAIELLSYRHGLGPARAYVAELLDKISNLRKAYDVLGGFNGRTVALTACPATHVADDR